MKYRRWNCKIYFIFTTDFTYLCSCWNMWSKCLIGYEIIVLCLYALLVNTIFCIKIVVGNTKIWCIITTAYKFDKSVSDSSFIQCWIKYCGEFVSIFSHIYITRRWFCWRFANKILFSPKNQKMRFDLQFIHSKHIFFFFFKKNGKTLQM